MEEEKMEEEKKPPFVISKHMAFDALLKRIVEDTPLAYDASFGICVYNPNFNGGCAIGAHLGDLYNESMEFGGSCGNLFKVHPAVGRLFENALLETGELYRDGFWPTLQAAHDFIAKGAFSHGFVALKRACALLPEEEKA